MEEVMRAQQKQWTEKKRGRDNKEQKSHVLGRVNEGERQNDRGT